VARSRKRDRAKLAFFALLKSFTSVKVVEYIAESSTSESYDEEISRGREISFSYFSLSASTKHVVLSRSLMEKHEGGRNFLTNDDDDNDDDDAHESTWTSMVRNDVIR